MTRRKHTPITKSMARPPGTKELLSRYYLVGSKVEGEFESVIANSPTHAVEEWRELDEGRRDITEVVVVLFDDLPTYTVKLAVELKEKKKP